MNYRKFSILLAIFVIAIFLLMMGCERIVEPEEIQGDAVSNLTLDKAGKGNVGINIVLNTEISDAILQDLGNYGKLLDVLEQINGVRILGKTSVIPDILALPYVEAAGPDAERTGRPIDTVTAEDFMNGLSTWNLDAVNVTDYDSDPVRKVSYDGTGVYVGILDTGLKDSWRQYFPEERIAVEYAKCFGGGGNDRGYVSEQPNKWEHDQDSHGTHVTSTVIGYSLGGTPINGVAPMATIIPVKVLNNVGWGWSSVITRGILYIAELKEGPLADYPVVINMSLGGPVPDPMERASINYAISKGVIVVASAGNRGEAGMGYPGGYAPVISAAASGWIGEWTSGGWWLSDVAEPTNPDDFYITDFSSRQVGSQDLDVAAPGSWVVGPYQLQSGKTSYYYLGGTSQAAPHVAGIVALMLQKNPGITAAVAESILETTAIPLAAPDCRDVYTPYGTVETYCWGANATGAGLVDAVAALALTP
jgi:subtilisin family serine protease